MLPTSGKLSIGESKVYNVHWGICSLLLLGSSHTLDSPTPSPLILALSNPFSHLPTSSLSSPIFCFHLHHSHLTTSYLSNHSPPLSPPLISPVLTTYFSTLPLSSPLSSHLHYPLTSSLLSPPLSSHLHSPLTSHLPFTLTSLSPLTLLLPGNMQSAHQFLSVLLRKATAQVHSASVVVLESTAKAVTTAILESAIEGRVSFLLHLSLMHSNMRSIDTC